MLDLREKMAFYNAYHRHPHNKLTHFIGVPLIIFALLVPMGWLDLAYGEQRISLAFVFVASVLFWHVMMDVLFALTLAVLVTPIAWMAHRVSTEMSLYAGGWVFLIVFSLGAVFQLFGHSIEGRKPALLDNAIQIFVSPLFLVAEIYFTFGFRKKMHREIQRRSKKYNHSRH